MEAAQATKKRRHKDDSLQDVQAQTKRPRRENGAYKLVEHANNAVVHSGVAEGVVAVIPKAKKKAKEKPKVTNSEVPIAVASSSSQPNGGKPQTRQAVISTRDKKDGKKKKNDSLAAFIIDPTRPGELLYSDFSTSPESRSVPPLDDPLSYTGTSVDHNPIAFGANGFSWPNELLDSSLALGPNASAEDILGSINSAAISAFRGGDKPKATASRKSTTSRLKKSQPTTQATFSEPLNPTDQAKMLSTKWLTTKDLKKLFEEQGLDYKRGPFTATEKAAIQSALDTWGIEHRLTYPDVINIMFTKRGATDPEHKTFWQDIAAAVPLRPLIAVFNYCKRAYHPLQKQGKWNQEEDEVLLAAVTEYGQLWEKVSERVGRMASDCRDRYRNHLQNAANHKHGSWTKEEETQLASIMEELGSTGEGADSEAHWAEVVRRMGGTRSRAQVRTKWQDSLRKHINSDGKRRWLPIDSYILIHKINDLDAFDDTEIDWKLLRDDTWNLWSAHVLQRRWASMKQGIEGWQTMTFRDLVNILLEKKGYMSPEQIEDAIEKTKAEAAGLPDQGTPNVSRSKQGMFTSREVIDDSDDLAGESD